MNKGLEIIKHFESCKLTAYKDSVGIWTIGWGTTAMAGLGIKPKRGMSITQAEADRLLEEGVSQFMAAIIPLLKREATDDQLGAFTSLAYNIGVPAFKNSTVLREFNNGNEEAAAKAFHLWTRAGGKVLKGLVRRRKSESHLFKTGEVKFFEGEV